MRLCSRPALISSLIVALSVLACAPEVEKFETRRSPRGSLGVEVYKSVCRRVAGTEYPSDVAGRQSEALCLGDTAQVQQALAAARAAPEPNPRLIALAERRERIAQAVDDMLPGELSDALEHLFRELLPFYDPPEERLQNATRSLADLIDRLLAPENADALVGLARVGREGMLSREGSMGLVRGPLGASHVRELALSVLTAAMDDPTVKPHYETVLNGLALELANTTLSADAQRDAERLKDLVLRPSNDFASGQPLFGVLRDPRGLPLPTPSATGEQVPFPFLDANGDGLADTASDGMPDPSGARLATRPEYTGRLPEPFPTLGEGPVARDEFGRAYAIAPDGTADTSRLLYRTVDADSTLLAGLLRAAKKVVGDAQLAESMSLALSSIVGAHAPTSQVYGQYRLDYAAPDAATSPLLDLVHASSALLDRPVAEESLALTQRIVGEHERELVAAVNPLLTLERRTRPGADAYPQAELRPNHTFWDELLFETEKLARRRNDANGETLLEALVRGTLGFGRNMSKPGTPIELISDPELLRHQGAVLATLMRYKDEWRANPKGESKREPTDPIVLGAFRTPVDRTQPETPVTCGRDGCGGLIAGTLFERWKAPNQQCMLQRRGRPITGQDCGQPANQSILHRSLGLIAEMAGRSQCNKPISIGDLLDFAVLKELCTGVDGAPQPDTPECEIARSAQRIDRKNSVDEAERAVAKDYACPRNPDGSYHPACAADADRYPAAFVDPDGPNTGEPAAIRECHMLDLPDVGRAFGAAVTHEFQLEFPNPWVRRYLEDIARADGSLPPCEAGSTNYPIVDPTVAPDCTPDAAKLSRDLYENDPVDAARLANVNTLAELVEFLLDDTTLFGDDPQDRIDLRPNVKSLSRVLFAPAGSTSFIVFDPLLVRGAPPICADVPLPLPACAGDDSEPDPVGGCCIADPDEPPLRYRLDTYYGATSFAWEHPLKLADGREISFLDTMTAISDAVARFDYNERRGDDPDLFEDTSYPFSSIGKLIAEHYDSADNPLVQGLDPTRLNYRRLTGLVKYEPMLADALDDGTLDHTQLAPGGGPLFPPGLVRSAEEQLGVIYHSLPLLQALDQLEFGAGRDGIDISSEVSEQLLSPHARCAGAEGDRRVIADVGACDLAKRGAPGYEQPFAYRDGREHICWNDGTCFPGFPGFLGQPARPRRFASPLYGMLDAVRAMDTASNVDPARDEALRAVLSGLLDNYLGTTNGLLSDRNARALLIGVLEQSRERIIEERAAGTLATFAARTDEETADVLHNPVVAGALGLFESLQGKGTAIRDLSLYAGSTLSEEPQQNNLRPLLAGLFDVVQLLPGNEHTNAALRALGGAFAEGASDVVQGRPGAVLSPNDSAMARNLYMLRETALRDEDNVLERVMQNVARVPEGRASPLEVILEAVLAINRAEPLETATPSAEDLRVAMQRIADVLRDDRRGFERLYTILRCSTRGATDAVCDE